MSSDSSVPHVATSQDLSQFDQDLVNLLFKAHKETNIPLEFIAFKLSLQHHDIMNTICVQNYQKYSQELSNKQTSTEH